MKTLAAKWLRTGSQHRQIWQGSPVAGTWACLQLIGSYFCGQLCLLQKWVEPVSLCSRWAHLQHNETRRNEPKPRWPKKMLLAQPFCSTQASQQQPKIDTQMQAC